MSLMDKIRSFFSGGVPSDPVDDHSHDGHDHSHDPVDSNAPTMPTDPATIPAAEPADEDSP
jgi:hypothetical protein